MVSSTPMGGAASVGPVARSLALLGVYLAAVAVLTWPLVASITTHHYRTVASFDTHHLTWTLAWESHALASDPARFADGNAFHPQENVVFRGPAAIGALPLFAPVFLATGSPTLAINLTYLLGLALTAWGLHLVVHAWTVSHAAGLVSAAAFLTCETAVRGLAASVPDHACLMYFPWILYLAAGPVPTGARVLTLGLAAALQSLVNTVYIAPVVIGPLAVLAVLFLVRPASRAKGLRLALAIAVALVLMAPVFLAYLSVFASSATLGDESRWARDPALAVLSLSDVLTIDPSLPSINAAQATPILLILLVLGALAALARRRDRLPVVTRDALVAAVVFFAVSFTLSLGPLLEVGGAVIRLPLSYLQGWFPPLERIRVAPRVGVGGLIGLAVLAGLSFAALLAWLRPRAGDGVSFRIVSGGLALAAAAALYLQDAGLGRPVRLQRAPTVDPELLTLLRASDGPILVLPQGLWQDARAMYQSIQHWRPLLNGYTAYWPPGFLERMELARRLPDDEALTLLVRETGLELIWLNVGGVPPAKRRAWEAEIARGRLRLLARTERTWLLEVVPAS